jgi:predicted enzyme related to lactoylglutathione lyase
MSRVVHFEIHAEDPDRAIRFYSELFQWQISKWEGPIDYWTIKTGPEDQKGINGGMIRRQGTIDGEAVIAYVCTISVSSVDATASAVEQNGGQVVVPKMPIPGVGWMVYCKDTEGNIFGAIEEQAQGD